MICEQCGLEMVKQWFHPDYNKYTYFNLFICDECGWEYEEPKDRTFTTTTPIIAEPYNTHKDLFEDDEEEDYNTSTPITLLSPGSLVWCKVDGSVTPHDPNTTDQPFGVAMSSSDGGWAQIQYTSQIQIESNGDNHHYNAMKHANIDNKYYHSNMKSNIFEECI